MNGTYVGLIAQQDIPQAAYKDTWTTGVSFLNTPIGTGTGLVTFPQNYFRPGKRLRVTAIMAVKNVTAAQPTFTFSLQFSSIAIWTSGAVSCTTTAHTTTGVAKLVVELRCATIGLSTSATFFGCGLLTSLVFAAGAFADTAGCGLCLPAAAPAAGSGFDSTIANTLDFYVACGTSLSTNGVQLFDYFCEDLN